MDHKLRVKEFSNLIINKLSKKPQKRHKKDQKRKIIF
jgi:hypothetical protein